MPKPPANVLQFRRRPPRGAKTWGQAWRETRLLVLLVALVTVGATGLIAARGGVSMPDVAIAGDNQASGLLSPPGSDTERANFDICSGPIRTNCVVDGDTFWYHGEKYRIADINTPEVSEPQCAREAQLGAAATERLHALLNAGPFSLESIDRDRDQYGRLLRNVTRDGESLGVVLVNEGLAEEWRGYRGSWC